MSVYGTSLTTSGQVGPGEISFYTAAHLHALSEISKSFRKGMEVHIKVNGQAVSVEVTIEVYEFLNSVKRKSENLAHEKRRHWDEREFNEYIIAREGQRYFETPEQWICHKETLQDIMAALESCTQIQRQRFLLFALDGLSYAEIGKLCGCSKYAVRDSIAAVRKKCRDFFENGPHETGFSG